MSYLILIYFNSFPPISFLAHCRSWLRAISQGPALTTTPCSFHLRQHSSLGLVCLWGMSFWMSLCFCWASQQMWLYGYGYTAAGSVLPCRTRQTHASSAWTSALEIAGWLQWRLGLAAQVHTQGVGQDCTQATHPCHGSHTTILSMLAQGLLVQVCLPGLGGSLSASCRHTLREAHYSFPFMFHLLHPYSE